jgi:CBS domain-containing protein
MISAGDFCNREVVIASPSESVLAAARRMRDHHVGSVVIVSDADGGRIPVGILTDRDVVVGPLADGAPDLDAVRVGDVMGAPLTTAREDESLLDVLKRMRSFGFRRLPVIDRDGRLAGLITFDDVIELLCEELTDLAELISREQRRERRARS